MTLSRAIQDSAFIADLKAAAALVKPHNPMVLPSNPKQRAERLRALLMAERRRNVLLIRQMVDNG